MFLPMSLPTSKIVPHGNFKYAYIRTYMRIHVYMVDNVCCLGATFSEFISLRLFWQGVYR